MQQEIRILLIDDHTLFRESLSRLLSADPQFKIVGDCSSIAEAMKFLSHKAIDVILLDYDLGEEQGFAFLDQAKKANFQGRVLMVTAGMQDSSTLQALQSGVAGIFLKHSPPSQLAEAIRKIVQGEIWLDPKAVQSLVAAAAVTTDEHKNSQALTLRERSVLKGVLEGLSNKEIGAQLEISESSVKAAIQQLFEKTGVRSRSQLVRIALEQKILS